MAKDGTNRGGRRVRAGGKPDALADKVARGETARVMDFPVADLEGADDLGPVADLTGADTVFSTEMVIATLDYSGPHISAYLHQFTLLRLIDCRKEDVYRYQFLITPEEYPEFFDIAV